CTSRTPGKPTKTACPSPPLLGRPEEAPGQPLPPPPPRSGERGKTRFAPPLRLGEGAEKRGRSMASEGQARSPGPAPAPPRAGRTARMTASGKDQLSYCAASTRKTNTAAIAKT